MKNNGIGYRLKEIRTEHKMTQAALAKVMGVSSTTISLIETGDRTPSDTFLKLLNEMWRYRIEWILDGKGSKKEEQISLDEIANKYDIDENERILLIKYMTLDKETKKKIKELFI